MPPSELKRLAVLIAVNCVRNTVLEDYHADGKLSDPEMMALNKKVVNKIYTFLHYIFRATPKDQDAFLAAMGLMWPADWDSPKLDDDFMATVTLVKQRHRKAERSPNLRASPKRSQPASDARRKKKR